METNIVYHDDCFNVIKDKIDDNSLDLVIVDPPYGDNIGYGRSKKEIINNESVDINFRFLDEIYVKMKANTPLYLFTNHKFCCDIRNYARDNTMFKYRMSIIIVKNNIGMGYGFRNQYEVCLVFEKGDKVKYLFNDVSNVWNMKHVQHDDTTHPHQKDYDLIRKIILHSSNKDDVVFDGFMGSFSTAVACSREGRKYIGAELDKKWYDYGMKRLTGFESQKRLPF